MGLPGNGAGFPAAFRVGWIDPGHAADQSADMKLFCTPIGNDGFEHTGAVCAGALAITVQHGQLFGGYLEADFCAGGIGGHGATSRASKKTNHRTARQTAAHAVVYTRIKAKGVLDRETGQAAVQVVGHKSGGSLYCYVLRSCLLSGFVGCSEFWPNHLPIVWAQLLQRNRSVAHVDDAYTAQHGHRPLARFPLMDCWHADPKFGGQRA